MPFVRNLWYAASWSKDLEAGSLLYRKIIGDPLLLTRQADGKPVVLSNACPHRFAPMHMGQRVGESVRCPYHGLRFDLQGRCVENPNTPHTIPPGMALRRYPAVERHTMLWVWMGDAEPDESLIPDFSLMENEALSRDRGHFTMAVNVELIANNLMDLSHASFLHNGLLGTPEHGEADIKVAQEGHTVTCSRMSRNVPVPQVFDLLYRRDGAPVDFWNSMRWDPPYSFFLDVGCHAPGGSRADSGGLYGVHILSPESEAATHYFVGIARKPATEADAEFQAEIARLRMHAFRQQDEPLLQAMQEMLGIDGLRQRQPVLLSIDGGPVRMKRVLDDLLAREAAAAHTPAGHA
jgi:vanillate O-demethylase monooxygenase subunit